MGAVEGDVGARPLPRVHPDVVDRDVEAAQRAGGLDDHRLERRVVARVGDDRERRAALPADLRHDRFGMPGPDVVHRDGGAGARQPPGDLAPDAGPEPGDEGAPPRQVDRDAHAPPVNSAISRSTAASAQACRVGSSVPPMRMWQHQEPGAGEPEGRRQGLGDRREVRGGGHDRGDAGPFQLDGVGHGVGRAAAAVGGPGDHQVGLGEQALLAVVRHRDRRRWPTGPAGPSW